MKSKTFTTIAFVLLLAVRLSSPVYSGSYSQESLTPEQFTQDFDYLWSQLKDNYAYFDTKETDWNRVRAFYRPRVAAGSKTEFIALLERVLEELYDSHTHLRVNTSRSPRLVPSGLDVWAEWINGKAIITQLRKGFSAEQAGLKVGMQIIAINGSPVETAVRNRLGVSLKRVSEAARNWALRASLAGAHDTRRFVEVQTENGVKTTFQLDLPTHTTVDNYQDEPGVVWKILPERLGYIKISDLGSDDTVPALDAALEQVKTTRGLIIDLRATQSGGNTSVAEPIMGRLIERQMPYQKGTPMHGESWTREVSPGGWTYKAPIVVLVGRWTASMGEGIAIGLDGMRRATVVGTRMAGLNGAVFDLELPNTKIKLNYAAEKLFHVNGTPREDFVPFVAVKLSNKRTDDVILAEGIRTLRGLLKRRLRRHFNSMLQ